MLIDRYIRFYGSRNKDHNPLGQINKYFVHCIFEGHRYDLIDVAIVGFNYKALIIQDFIPLLKLKPLVLSAGAPTAMGEGIN